jgi:hypothetical protein
VYVTSLHGEFEDLQTRSKREKSDILVEVDSMARKVREMEETTGGMSISIDNISEMMTCLVENA